MIAFKDLEPNSIVYILNLDNASLEQGKVISRGFPRYPESNSNDPFQRSVQTHDMPSKVVDIRLEAFGKTATYVMTENASVNYAGSFIFATDKRDLVPKIQAMKQASESAIADETIKKHNNIISASKKLLEELDPVFKSQQETDTRFSGLENRMGNMETSVSEMKDLIKTLVKKLE